VLAGKDAHAQPAQRLHGGQRREIERLGGARPARRGALLACAGKPRRSSDVFPSSCCCLSCWSSRSRRARGHRWGQSAEACGGAADEVAP
jgi:hypothetical protein